MPTLDQDGPTRVLAPVRPSSERPDRVAPWRRPGVLLFAAAAALYLAGGLWLSLSADSVMSDALSRTANGYYPVFSRDPHLAAIGFVWNPLPSLVELPMLLLTPLWGAIANHGVAAIVQSALFMAGAVYQVQRSMDALGVGRRVGWVLTALFALHPEIAYYGMNGMSEASYLFFLLLAVHQLIRWITSGRSNSLAAAGLALGAAYLTRYESVAAGLAATVAVALISYARADGSRAFRWATARADAVVLATPFVFSVTTWALTSWLIVGSPFAQFTSVNGNTAQTKLASAGINAIVGQPGGALSYLLHQSWVLQPFGIVLIVAAVVRCWYRRDPVLLAPVSVLAGAYGFSVLALLAGQTFGWLRFSITIVPLVVFAGAILLRPAPARSVLGDRVDARVAAVVVVVLLGVALPAAAHGMLNPGLAREESYFLTGIFAPDRASKEQKQVRHRYEQDRTLAGWLDRQHLPEGAVLLDAAVGYDVVLSSERPRQFAITPDRDFPLLLGDPGAHGVRYLVTRPVATGAPADAISDAYPDLARNPSFELVRVEPNRGDLPAWHVYAVR
ncbi:glycosyltransferase family 39 protein [Cryptosporangium phraense]|uniref:ABC transporter n=1 Tax=Cryptosporangium phraense TaxID=2593070 RepID=A0A545AG53_9ACTN|nr:glycosyltransferase family 39 protein [Cryptosporangium phraense]TQS40313.1 ABC transporter [Cryptosporangium phraense]